MDQHLEHNGLMEGQQRGAKSGCFGTMDNLLIDRAVMLDCQRGKRNLSMAWSDVRKAFDSVDRDWLCAMMTYTGFPEACETESTLEDSFLDQQSISDETHLLKKLTLSFLNRTPKAIYFRYFIAFNILI